MIPLSAATEVAAYRIVEESVANVVKHAQATRVDVSMRLVGQSLEICVVDNGVGIRTPSGGSGMGLQSIRERATELGGTVVIESGPGGSGTGVRVALPTSPGSG